MYRGSGLGTAPAAEAAAARMAASHGGHKQGPTNPANEPHELDKLDCSENDHNEAHEKDKERILVGKHGGVLWKPLHKLLEPDSETLADEVRNSLGSTDRLLAQGSGCHQDTFW